MHGATRRESRRRHPCAGSRGAMDLVWMSPLSPVLPPHAPPRPDARPTRTAPLALDDVGRGPALVLLHAFPLDRSLWRHQRDALATRARCLVPDLPGFGASPASGTHDVDALAETVRALLDARGIERAVIAGISMGGYVAMACWRRFPERIAGLGFLATRMEADDDDARARRDALASRVRSEGATAVVAAMLPGLLGRSSRRRRPELDRALSAVMHATAPSTILDGLHAMRDRPDSTGTVGTVTVPTLLLAGDEDVLTPPSVLGRLAAALPPDTPRLQAVVTGAGHLPCLERPAAVTLALADLLDRCFPPHDAPAA